MARVVSVSGRRTIALDAGWELALSAPGAWVAPGAIADDAEWLPAVAPGTAAAALQALGRWSLDAPTPLHDKDVWYRARVAGSGRRKLRFGGLATMAEVWLDAERVLVSDNMFEAHEIEVDLTGRSVLQVAFRSLDVALKACTGPRARWRPKMIAEQKLRLVRTTLLGHMPGWCPPVHAIGPWRAIEVVDEGDAPKVGAADVRASLRGDIGHLAVRIETEISGQADLLCAGVRAAMRRDGTTLVGELALPGIERWWPHTHGEPRLHAVTVCIGDVSVDLGRVGFRDIAVDRGADGRGFALVINGVRVFCRGACWTPPDIVALPCSREVYAGELGLARDAGVNMLRVGGTIVYEAPAFHDLCDELGILVWQDAMLANFDYPGSDDAFLGSVRREISGLLDGLQTSPSLAVFCGGSEVQQQAAMLGLPPAAWSSPLFDAAIPQLVRQLRPDVVYLPSSPSGGELPFVADAGVAHYYGVGAYCRPLEDARRADVRFAAECLAFANVPDEATLEKHLAEPAVHHPGWKERVPRDAGATWDFEDIREHYLAELYGIDCARLRREDPARYLALSRATTAEVVERTIDEWRRPGSSCGGALVWFWKDLWPGAGWGVVDATGRPKSVWHALRRAYARLRLILSDEGVNGLVLHAVNDGPNAVAGTLALECWGDAPVPLVAGQHEIEVGPHGCASFPATALLGRFFDANYAYRFGPPAHDLALARLTGASGEILAEGFHLLPHARRKRERIGLTAKLERDETGWQLRVRSEQAALFVHVREELFEPEDDWFHLVPRTERVVRLRVAAGTPEPPRGHVEAVNARDIARYDGAALRRVEAALERKEFPKSTGSAPPRRERVLA